MDDLVISIGADAASDAWGFVGVVKVGEVQAYRTFESFSTPALAAQTARSLVADVLGELLAAREWRGKREQTGAPPTRLDFALSPLHPRRFTQPPAPLPPAGDLPTS